MIEVRVPLDDEAEAEAEAEAEVVLEAPEVDDASMTVLQKPRD